MVRGTRRSGENVRGSTGTRKKPASSARAMKIARKELPASVQTLLSGGQKNVKVSPEAVGMAVGIVEQFLRRVVVRTIQRRGNLDEREIVATLRPDEKKYLRAICLLESSRVITQQKTQQRASKNVGKSAKSAMSLISNEQSSSEELDSEN